MASAESKPEPTFDASKVTDLLTDTEKKGPIGKMITYITSTMSSGFSISRVSDNVVAMNKLKDHIGKVEDLLDNLIKSSKPKEDIIQEAQDFHSKNCTGVMDNLDFGPCIDLITLDEDTNGLEKIKTQILNILKGEKQRESDALIKQMGKADSIAATIQFVKLFYAWKAISAASNVLEDKDKFKLINEKLLKIESMVTELVEICETQPEDKSIIRKTTNINTLCVSTTNKISDIRVEINGHIQRLELVSDYAFVDAVSNTITAVSRGYQLWNLFESLSSPTKWFGAMTVGMYGLFGVCNAAVLVITQDKLKELRKDLRNVNNLRETLDDLREQVENATL